MSIKGFFTSTKNWVTRPQYAQVMVVALAFALMVILGSYFMGNIVHRHLKEAAEAALNFTQAKIKSDLLEPETMLGGVAETIRSMIMRGESAESVHEYIIHINNYVWSNDKIRLSGVIGFYGTFDVYDGEFLSGTSDWTPPDDYVVQGRPWYEAAVAANGDIGCTQPYMDVYTGELAITFSRRIFDEVGSPLGIVCLDMKLDRVREYAVNTYFTEGGYGILLNNELEVIAHPNETLLGKKMYDLEKSIASLASDLEQKKILKEYRVKSHQGESSIVFFRQIENDWYVGVVTPESNYITEVRAMWLTLLTLAVILTLIVSAILVHIIKEKQRSDERTRIMFDAMPLCANFWDKNYQNIDCNKEAIKLFEVSGKQEYIDRFYEFSPEFQPCGKLSRKMALEMVKKAFKEGYLRFEWMHKKANGEPLPCEVTLVRVKYRKENIVAGYTRDLREQRAMLREMHRAEMAESSNRVKSDFLARVSHEIRTPMNAILGITEIQLQDESLTPEMEEALGQIYNSGYLLLDIINDILDLSKIEAGKLELMPVRYEVASLINDTIHLNALRFDSKPIEINLQVDENMPAALIGDDLRIKQILNNLLSNAFKYTDRGEINFSVFAEEETTDRITLVFRVQDTGQGMNAEQVNKLFDEYTRFNMKANRTTMGTGLGMSITRQIVHMMNGSISVESEPGKGSLFFVRLPQEKSGVDILGKEAAERLRNFHHGRAAQMEKAPVVREYMPYGRVLVVDDVATNLYVARGLLAPYGLSIETLSSGYEAIESIKNGASYDIIFMDHFMPRMDGIEAAQLIRDLGYTKPIIALTANAITGQAEMFLANGFDGFISKPIDIRQLNAVLNQQVRNKYPPEIIEAARRLRDGLKKPSVAGAQQPPLDMHLAKIFMQDAEKAAVALEALCKKQNGYEEEDIQNYIINIHSMKSALANIGETELSNLAFKLEQAGREKNIALISAETPMFLGLLRAVTSRIKPKDDGADNEHTEGDQKLLREKLTAVQTACAKYDKKAAKEALAELRLKTWPSKTGKLLDAIAEHLLHSEFEEAANLAGAYE